MPAKPASCGISIPARPVHVTITVEQEGGVRFKTLAKNVVVTKQP
jgi:hypothetical protein